MSRFNAVAWNSNEASSDNLKRLNKEAFARLREPKELRIVPGATHLFEEPGALDQVSRLAREWFERYLG